MYNFNKIDPSVQKALHFQFSNKLNGDKIKKNTSIICNGQTHKLPHSIIKIGDELYQIATGPHAIIGKGNFGKVKYIQHLVSKKCFALKIESFNPFSSNKKLKSNERFINKENAISLDINLTIAFAKRCNALYQNKNYSVMQYRGLDLKKVLEAPNKYHLTNEIRFDIAIKLCYEVFKLHTGLTSNQALKYVHQDIKPNNITLNNTSEPSLIDFGLACTSPDKLQQDFVGSPAYMPSIYELAQNTITQQQKDMLALKRTLYMPNIIKCALGLKIDASKNHFNLSHILPTQAVENKKLASYVDTGGQNNIGANAKLTPLSLAAILVLAKTKMPLNTYKKVTDNHYLASKVLAIYFDIESTQNLKTNILASISNCSIERKSITHKKAHQMTSLDKKALLITYGITEDLHFASDNELLINILISNETLALKKAAIILFKLSILESNSVFVLKNNTELLPIVSQKYHKHQHGKIISVFLLPYDLSHIMNKLKQANASNKIFDIARNVPMLRALMVSSSANYTKALLFLFEQKHTINEKDINGLNSFKANAINFLLENNQSSQYPFVMKGNNSLIFYAIETLINSKLMPNADQLIIPNLKLLMDTPSYTDLIKDHTSPKKVCVIYHLFKNSIKSNKVILDKLFMNSMATENLFKYLQKKAMSPLLIKKIINNDAAANAFIFLSEQKYEVKQIVSELNNDIRIRQISENLTLPPLSTNHMLQKLSHIEPINTAERNLKYVPLGAEKIKANTSSTKQSQIEPLGIAQLKIKRLPISTIKKNCLREQKKSISKSPPHLSLLPPIVKTKSKAKKQTLSIACRVPFR